MTPALEKLDQTVRDLRASGVLTDIDVYLAESVLRNCGIRNPPPELQLAVALAGRAIHSSHVCLDLDEITPEWVLSLNPVGEINADDSLTGALKELCGTLRDVKKRAKLFCQYEDIIGGPGSVAPFICQEPLLLYLRRFWSYENTVARKLVEMARAGKEELTPGLAAKLNKLLDKEEQRNAARMALTRRFCIITGGPGTGKTYTAARVLALCTHMKADGGRPLRVRISAPTGKAAARMDESLRTARGKRGAGIFRPGSVIEPACTIDRLLGHQSGSPYFRHNKDNPIPADVVLIDEASMIDLAKMAKLLDALDPDTRLILLGDMHQLASVQPGSVLAEICLAEKLSYCVAELTESVRFGSNTPIGKLSIAVNTADTDTQADEAWRLFCGLAEDGAGNTGLRHHRTPDSIIGRGGVINADFTGRILDGYRGLTRAKEPEQAFAALKRFRVLCAMRRGPFGVEAVNRAIERALGLEGTGEGFYSHRVIMVTRNDYSINLFNGDVGIILPDPGAGGELKAFFEVTGGDAQGKTGYRKISRQLLPGHETAFAMTIHKSQGSEFDNILVIMPDRANPILTRELIYTALTRAKDRVELWTDESIFKQTIQAKVRRFSGLGTQIAAI